MRRFAAAQVGDCDLQIQPAANGCKACWGFTVAASAEHLEPAIRDALDEGGFVEIEPLRHLPGMTRAVLRTVRKIWAADLDLAAKGHGGHRRIADMSLIEPAKRLPSSSLRDFQPAF